MISLALCAKTKGFFVGLWLFIGVSDFHAERDFHGAGERKTLQVLVLNQSCIQAVHCRTQAISRGGQLVKASSI